MTDLKAEYIKCRDALACAVNWLEPSEPPDVKMEIPSDKLEWLNGRLDEATVLADKLATEEAETSEGFLHDEDFLQTAFDVSNGFGAADAVSLCERISQRYNAELTLEQAEQLLERIEDLCEGCLKPLNEETGYCDPCSEPGSASKA